MTGEAAAVVVAFPLLITVSKSASTRQAALPWGEVHAAVRLKAFSFSMLPPPSTALPHLPASQRILAESGCASRPAEVAVGKDPLLYGRPRRPFAQLAQHFKEIYMAMPKPQNRHRSPVPNATPEGSVASITGIDRVEELDAGHAARGAQCSDASLIAIISTDIPWPLSPSLRCALSLDGRLTVQLGDLKPPLLAYQLPASGVDYTAAYRSHIELQPFKLEGVTYVRFMVFSDTHV